MDWVGFQNALFNFFALFGGFGMFLYGMHIMADGLQKTAGNKMKNLLGALTNNRFLGVIVGALVTAIVQSSSASTVMVIGFVNAGLMNLVQATGVIMGANIGTTITSWIVSSGEWMVFFKPEKIAPLIMGLGASILFFSKDKKKQQIGEILVGFSLIFIGLELMKSGITPYRDSQVFKDAFIVLGKNPILAVFAGAVVTAIIQSSSASVGILQTLAATGIIPFSAAIYIVLGQNIGTTVTAMLSSIGASKTAKRAAYVHLLFNVFGTVVFTIGTFVYFEFFDVRHGHTIITMTQISIFHTFFNVTNTAMLLPFINQLAAIAEKIVPGVDRIVEDEEELTLRHLDERILETPTFAVENAIKEVARMGDLAVNNTRLAIEALIEKDNKKIAEVISNEKKINKLEKLITDYLVKISNSVLNEHQNLVITNLFHSVNDIERVGDHAENIAELAKYYVDNELKFSEEAEEEFKVISKLALDTISIAIEARRDDNADLVKKVESNEEEMDVMEEYLRGQHIKRLGKNLCDSSTGVVFLDSISNLERITDHALNLAYYVKDEII
jgi:phosphate:Na+ symporter